MSRTLEYELTSEMKTRIKNLRDAKGYSNKDLAIKAFLKESHIKNILSPNGTASISNSTLVNLSDALECTRDYLLLKSDNPNKDNTGRTIYKALSLEERNNMISHISEYLHNDYETLKSLYFVLNDLPLYYRMDFLKGLNISVRAMQNSTLWKLARSLNTEDFKLIQNCIEYNNPRYAKLITDLSTAKRDIALAKYEHAVSKLLNIILVTISEDMMCAPIARDSYKTLQTLISEELILLPRNIKRLINEFNENDYIRISSDSIVQFQKAINKYIGSLEQ